MNVAEYSNRGIKMLVDYKPYLTVYLTVKSLKNLDKKHSHALLFLIGVNECQK